MYERMPLVYRWELVCAECDVRERAAMRRVEVAPDVVAFLAPDGARAVMIAERSCATAGMWVDDIAFRDAVLPAGVSTFVRRVDTDACPSLPHAHWYGPRW